MKAPNPTSNVERLLRRCTGVEEVKSIINYFIGIERYGFAGDVAQQAGMTEWAKDLRSKQIEIYRGQGLFEDAALEAQKEGMLKDAELYHELAKLHGQA